MTDWPLWIQYAFWGVLFFTGPTIGVVMYRLEIVGGERHARASRCGCHISLWQDHYDPGCEHQFEHRDAAYRRKWYANRPAPAAKGDRRG